MLQGWYFFFEEMVGYLDSLLCFWEWVLVCRIFVGHGVPQVFGEVEEIEDTLTALKYKKKTIDNTYTIRKISVLY